MLPLSALDAQLKTLTLPPFMAQSLAPASELGFLAPCAARSLFTDKPKTQGCGRPPFDFYEVSILIHRLIDAETHDAPVHLRSQVKEAVMADPAVMAALSGASPCDMSQLKQIVRSKVDDAISHCKEQDAKHRAAGVAAVSAGSAGVVALAISKSRGIRLNYMLAPRSTVQGDLTDDDQRYLAEQFGDYFEAPDEEARRRARVRFIRSDDLWEVEMPRGRGMAYIPRDSFQYVSARRVVRGNDTYEEITRRDRPGETKIEEKKSDHSFSIRRLESGEKDKPIKATILEAVAEAAPEKLGEALSNAGGFDFSKLKLQSADPADLGTGLSQPQLPPKPQALRQQAGMYLA